MTREEAIKAIKCNYPPSSYSMLREALDMAIEALQEPERKKGQWIHDGRRIECGVDWWHCSECLAPESGVYAKKPYCPNCGAYMRGEEE